MDPVVRPAREAIERRDWVRLKPLLHPAHLASAPEPSAPDAHELRDVQIYRWTERSRS